MITNAGTPLYIDGVEYELSPLNLEDLEYLDSWIAGRVLEAARMSLDGVEDLGIRQETMEAASSAAMKSSLFNGQGLDVLMKPLGCSRFLMRLLRRNEPRVSAQQCFDWMMRPDLKAELRDKLLSVFRGAIAGKGAQQKEPALNGDSIKKPSSGTSLQPESNHTTSVS